MSPVRRTIADTVTTAHLRPNIAALTRGIIKDDYSCRGKRIHLPSDISFSLYIQNNGSSAEKSGVTAIIKSNPGADREKRRAMGWSSHGGRRLSGLVFSLRYKNVCVCDVGLDGSGNIEWQRLLGEAAEAAISAATEKARASKQSPKLTRPEPSFSVEICEENGGEPPPSSNVVKIGDKRHGGRDCGGPRRPHCSVHRKKRPPQQGLYSQRHQRPPCPALGPHCYPVLRCAGSPRHEQLSIAHQEARASIDELAELPPWDPATAGFTPKTSKTATGSTQQQSISDEKEHGLSVENVATSKTAAVAEVHNMQQQMAENLNSSSGFLPPSLDSDVIADTIKTFFPMGACTETSSPTIRFQNNPPDLMSRTSSQSQDLRLSLLSFQEPTLLRHQAHHHGHQAQQHPPEITRFQGNPVAWNAEDVGGGGRAGLIFNASLPPTQTMPSLPLVQPLFGQNQFFSQRGTLQSSNTPSFRAWTDPAINLDHLQQQQSAISGIGFTASDAGFSGFRVPARVEGEEEECNKPSSDSRRLVHCLRQSTMGLRRCFQDWLEGWDSGRLEMNQSQIPWEKREIRMEFQSLVDISVTSSNLTTLILYDENSSTRVSGGDTATHDMNVLNRALENYDLPENTDFSGVWYGRSCWDVVVLA
uniref:Uncharacterized protein n=1 Tax=Salix viminalis TaxID=40686 RepID=A0A6N2M1U7_SALVM